MDLTQTGTALTGTITMKVRTLKSPPPKTDRGGPCDTVGTGVATAVTGTVSGLSFSLSTNGTRGGTFSGNVAGNRMTGVLICSGDGTQIATFAATRQ